MSKKRMVSTTAGTIGCALAIGWVMQNTAAPPASSAAIIPAPIDKTVLEPKSAPAVLPEVQKDASAELPLKEIKLTSIETPLPAISEIARNLIATVSYEPDVAPTMPAEPLAPYLGCEITAKAVPAPLATVDLTVTAPCNGGQRVRVHHAGMTFSETTSAAGRLKVTIPAMSENAVFVIEFDNGKGAVATTQVSGMSDVDRVAVQWSGDNGFQVHAREFGAAYGSDGHVWAGSESSRNGGSFTRLGTVSALEGNVVEIYTFPTGAATRSGSVALTVEAEVTPTNCGRDISAQSIELRRDFSLRTQELVLSMPDCSAVGDFLVLNNLVDDLKIAAR